MVVIAGSGIVAMLGLMVAALVSTALGLPSGVRTLSMLVTSCFLGGFVAAGIREFQRRDR